MSIDEHIHAHWIATEMRRIDCKGLKSVDASRLKELRRRNAQLGREFEKFMQQH